MSLRQRYRKILGELLPAGVMGASLLLGAAPPVAASEGPAGEPVRTRAEAPVSERLAAIREAVSDVAEPGTKAGPQLAWWANGGWRNGGGGWRNGGVWRNGGGGWHNGGWGWHNGGWHNGWHNYWRNW
jgi:hypothetical protein